MWSKLGWKSKNEKRGESLSAGGRWAAQLQEWKPRRNRDFSFLNGDSKNNPPLSSTDCWEHPVEERLNGWVRVWDRGFLCGLGVEWGPLSALEALSKGSRLSPWLLFSGQVERGREGEREGTHHWSCTETWRGHTVMPRTHTHTNTKGRAHNHYLKGFANLPDSQPVWQPVMQLQTFVMTG